MRSVARGFVRLVSLLVPRRRRGEFRQEWEAELACDARTAGGASGSRQALRVSGALPDAVELFFEDWSFDMLVQDIRYALRLAVRRAGFTTIIVGTLALGIGANTAIFSVVNAVLLRPMPYPEADRLFVVWEDDRLNGKPRYSVAPGNFTDWQTQARGFTGFCAYFAGDGTLAGPGDPERVSVAVVWPNFNNVTAVSPVLGRGFEPDDGKPGSNRIALISHASWQARFGGDPSIVGREIRLNDVAYRVIGVMPRGFSVIDESTELWRPMVFGAETATNRAQHFLTVLARLAPGTTFEAARAELDAIAIRGQQAFPATNDKRGVTLVPIAEQAVGKVRRPLTAVAAAVGIVLLIGCANVANLLLAAANSRRREFAVRAALGAGRARLTRQLLTEGIVLAAMGGIVGLGLAAAGTRVLASQASRILPRVSDLALDWRVFAFAAAVSLATGVCFALLPALQGARGNVQQALNDGGRTGQGRASRRAGSVLVVAELALAVVLVAGATLAVRSFWNVQQVNAGFSTDDVLTAEMDLPASRYGGPPQVYQFHMSLIDRLRATPGVKAAGIVNALPLTRPGPTTWFTIEGAPAAAGEPPEVSLRSASPGYFEAMRIPVLEGTIFPASQPDAAPRIALINRALEARFFAGRNPLGVRVRLGPNPKAAWRTIVGVIGDVHHDSLERPVAPEVYMPWADYAASTASLAISVDGRPADMVPAVRAIVQALDGQLPRWPIRPMSDLAGESAAGRRATMILLALFAGLALVLALVGVYGVMAYSVSQRVVEIGVRMALGAPRSQVLRMIIGQGMTLGVAGLIIGVVLALASAEVAKAMLFGVEPTDRLTFAIVSVSVLAVIALASYVPARRAARIDPISALRQ